MGVGKSRHKINEQGSLSKSSGNKREIKGKRDEGRTLGHRKVQIDYGQIIPVEWCL